MFIIFFFYTSPAEMLVVWLEWINGQNTVGIFCYLTMFDHGHLFVVMQLFPVDYYHKEKEEHYYIAI